MGGVLSPLLANVYLHALDALWEARAALLGTLVRYADDMVVLCRTEAEARAAHDWIVATLRGLKLEAHTEKTRVVCVADGTQGFDFLGFHLRRLPGWRDRTRWAATRWPSQRALKAIRTKIKQVTTPRAKLFWPVEDLVKELNPVLRGWGAYFRGIGTSRQMAHIDRYVIRRLALFMRKKHHRSTMYWARCNGLDWQRGVGLYRLAGRITAKAPP